MQRNYINIASLLENYVRRKTVITEENINKIFIETIFEESNLFLFTSSYELSKKTDGKFYETLILRVSLLLAKTLWAWCHNELFLTFLEQIYPSMAKENFRDKWVRSFGIELSLNFYLFSFSAYTIGRLHTHSKWKSIRHIQIDLRRENQSQFAAHSLLLFYLFQTIIHKFLCFLRFQSRRGGNFSWFFLFFSPREFSQFSSLCHIFSSLYFYILWKSKIFTLEFQWEMKNIIFFSSLTVQIFTIRRSVFWPSINIYVDMRSLRCKLEWRTIF